MVDSHPRVVVLGRPGEAQQQLLNALNELGAQPIAVGDFDQLDPAQVRAQQPDVWLVSIDEGTDSTRMDQWQPMFDEPGATVIFDDADVTRRLSGWDLARWARHLAAKVLGRDDVLPPVSPEAERLPRASMTPADAGEAGHGDVATDSSTDFSFTGDIDLADLNHSFESAQSQSHARDESPALSLDDLLRQQMNPEPAPAQAPRAAAGSNASPGAPAPTSSLPTELSLLDLDVDLTAPRGAKSAEPSTTKFDLGHLELEPLQEKETAKDTGPSNGGLIAIIAGLGGPDAVRQFLAGLPANLNVPVLLWQHLDAGKHDRLVQQLSKATQLPVYLANPEELAISGAVGVMSTGMGLRGDEGWWFRRGSPSSAHAIVPALADAGTVVVVLSGAEIAIVDHARAYAAKGGKILVQTPSTCFDATAASALASQGIKSGAPGDLALDAAEGWTS